MISHYNVQPMINVYASVSGRDLGAVADEVTKRVSRYQKELPRGSHIVIAGQVLDDEQHRSRDLGWG